jgi:flavin reductase (DIM6/NTAB) family NADH-FMN oxidoreductase RutF/DNA-binding GntR family transcriptional regulator
MVTNGTEVDYGDRRFAERQIFQDVIGHFASGVTIITTRYEETDFGLTASAVACLSLDPPMILVCIHKKSGTCHAIAGSKVFVVNILHEDQGELAIHFAKQNTDKFAGLDTSHGELGVPLLNGVLAHIECRLVEEVTGGTHSVFLAEVQKASANEGSPLAYYRGKFGRFQAAQDEMVYRRIRRLVLERELAAGQILNMNDLAIRLEEPRQAVYYAMTRLESEGLVAREEGHYIVNSLNAAALNEALDTRCALEIAAVEKTVGRLTEQELAELRKRMERTLPPSDGGPESPDRYIEANTAFHDFIVALARNATLLDSYRRLTAEAVMTSSLQVALEARDAMAHKELNSLTQDHVSLVKAYEAKDLETAKLLIVRHTEEAKRLGRYLIDSAGGRI